jgi:hypothetical protein
MNLSALETVAWVTELVRRDFPDFEPRLASAVRRDSPTSSFGTDRSEVEIELTSVSAASKPSPL